MEFILEKKVDLPTKSAFDICNYSRSEIIRVGKVAFDLALTRRCNLIMVDKANVLETSRLWRETIQELALVIQQ